jgi:UDP-N-acetylmuramyl tripeptide synthase
MGDRMKRSELEMIIAQVLLGNKVSKKYDSSIDLAQAIVKALEEANVGPYMILPQSGLRHAIHYEREDI